MTNYYSGTAGTSASGFSDVLGFNSPYIAVSNTSTGILYITTDGTTAPVTSGGADIYEIPANSTVVIPNQGAGTWHQSQSVIAQGELVGGLPGTPAEILPYGSSLAGGKTDPGVTINTIASAASTTFTITEVG